MLGKEVILMLPPPWLKAYAEEAERYVGEPGSAEAFVHFVWTTCGEQWPREGEDNCSGCGLVVMEWPPSSVRLVFADGGTTAYSGFYWFWEGVYGFTNVLPPDIVKKISVQQ